MAKVEVSDMASGGVVRDLPVHTREFAIIDGPANDPAERARTREKVQGWILEKWNTHLPAQVDLTKVDYATLQAAVQKYWEDCSPTPELYGWLRNVSFSELRGDMAVTPEYEAIAGHELAFRPKREQVKVTMTPRSNEISLHDIPGVIAEGLVHEPSGSVDWLAHKEMIYRLVDTPDSPMINNVRKVLSVLSLCQFPAKSIRAGYHPQRSSYMIWVHAAPQDFILVKCYSDRIQIGDYIVRTNSSKSPNT